MSYLLIFQLTQIIIGSSQAKFNQVDKYTPHTPMEGTTVTWQSVPMYNSVAEMDDE